MVNNLPGMVENGERRVKVRVGDREVSRGDREVSQGDREVSRGES